MERQGGKSSSRLKKQLKEYLWNKYSKRNKIKCFFCQKELDREEFTLDRFPVCGHRGGLYEINNIAPACDECNQKRGNTCLDNLPDKWQRRVKTKLRERGRDARRSSFRTN